MKRKARIEVYPGVDGWYWRLRAPNGKIIADGSEDYKSRGNAVRAARGVQRWLGHTVEVVEK